MKVLHVSYSAFGGGAGASARRLNEALCSRGFSSEFLYLRPYGNALIADSPRCGKMNGLINILIRKLIGRGRSLNIVPSPVLKCINQSDADIVHLHWIHGEMLSIAQIAQIKKPLVWTIHDMWPITGTRHCEENDGFIEGYGHAGGIEGWVYRLKEKHWKNLNVAIICPSTWMMSCVQRSRLFSGHHIETIPNVLNLEIFKPRKKGEWRSRFNLSPDKFIILFGSNSDDPMKGRAYLEDALLGMASSTDVEVVVFGKAKLDLKGKFNVRSLGMIEEETELSGLYSAANVVCVPSRMESFGLVAAEPLACGTPVVAFRCTGLQDVVDHKINGYLADPFRVDDFARGIEWVMERSENGCRSRGSGGVNLSKNARLKAERVFADRIVARQHTELYEAVLNPV